jgi:hypothetical protein
MLKRRKGSRRTLRVIPPVVIRPDRLPLLDSQLSWNLFEGFVRQLIRLQPGVKNVKRYGKAGSKQKGIDLIATREDGTSSVFQCKQWTTFKLANAKKAVRKTTYPADEYFLVIACQTDSTVHDYIDALNKWELWDVERVSDEVLRLPPEWHGSQVQQHSQPNSVLQMRPQNLLPERSWLISTKAS